MVRRQHGGFVLVAVCACLVLCSGMVIAYYKYYYQQSLTYRRLERSWIKDSQRNLQSLREIDQ